MREIEVFIFGLVNFAILVSVLLWGTRRLARQFFYARRMNTMKNLVASANILRSAKRKLKNSRALSENLQTDLMKRRAAAFAICGDECREIEDNAKRLAGHLIDTAARQGERERERALEAMRRNLMEEAFRKAFDIVRSGLGAGSGQAILEREICRFENAISKETRPVELE